MAIGNFNVQDPSAPDPMTLKLVLQGAGILGSNTSELTSTLAAELAKRGVAPSPDLTLLANGNYILIVRD